MEGSKLTVPTNGATQETSNVIVFVNSPKKLTSLLKGVDDLPARPPSLFLDAEGFHGDTVAFLHLFDISKNVVYRIAIATKSGSVDFSATNDAGTSLKSILESKSIPKITFDIRHLSHILFRQHNVKLAGIHDIQLLELASRDDKESKKYIAGIGKCVDQDVPPSNEVRKRWSETNNVDEYRAFNVLGHAPRSSIKRVELFPTLWRIYRSRLQRPGGMFWLAQARWETETRITLSQLPKFQISGKERALGPESWYDHELRERRIEEWNYELRMEKRAGNTLDEDANWVPHLTT